MEHAGTDLESIKLKTWSEAATILWQVSLALSEAEATLDFEVRQFTVYSDISADFRFVI